ncbi:MAG: cell division/cell wall cluster transcriptional repressor MraZ [Chloroflexi bacterium]|nr:MAG: cell division/cell wall cluster transcriptional repressor MraZ [Chloroflexota bacterium]TME14059.1 MAG: cell division/cell wall cluster transcriptional repressor MraZ [Chloroflexota bacterium]TME17998.1 MAG: cell division/cell wall cluster transcriptional repressor MraZ [Chloroflexota bacterium]
MFSGAFRPKVDAKGRLAIPKQYRDQLDRGAVISIGPETVLTIYPKTEWDNLRDVLRSPLTATPEQRELSRAMSALAVPCEFDAQGRVTLSHEQRRLAGIEPESTTVVIGNQTVVEIWAEARWDSYSAGAFSNFTDNVNKVTRSI